MPKKKRAEAKLYRICPKCGRAIEVIGGKLAEHTGQSNKEKCEG